MMGLIETLKGNDAVVVTVDADVIHPRLFDNA